MKLRLCSSHDCGIFVSVDGPSGAGKSTIVRHLARSRPAAATPKLTSTGKPRSASPRPDSLSSGRTATSAPSRWPPRYVTNWPPYALLSNRRACTFRRVRVAAIRVFRLRQAGGARKGKHGQRQQFWVAAESPVPERDAMGSGRYRDTDQGGSNHLRRRVAAVHGDGPSWVKGSGQYDHGAAAHVHGRASGAIGQVWPGGENGPGQPSGT